MVNEILKELEAIVGPDNVISDKARIFAEVYDSWLQILPGKPPKMPDYIVRPANEFEVQDIVLMANRYKIPIQVAGSYTYKLPCFSGILIQTSRMNRIHEVNVDEGYAVIDAGVTFNQFYRYLRSRNIDLTIPITTSPPNTSIVANFLFKGLAMGMTSMSDGNQDAIMALEAVLPTGELIHTGSWALQTASCKYTFDLGFGPQLTRIFVGALGTYGIVTKAAIKLWPKPKALTVKFLGVNKIEELAKHLPKIMYTKLAPNSSGGHWLLMVLHATNLVPYWGFEQNKKIYQLTDEDIVKMREYYGIPGNGTQYFYILACTPHYVSEDEAKICERAWSNYLSSNPEVTELTPENCPGVKFGEIEASIKMYGGIGEGEPGNQRIRYSGWVPGHIWSFYGSSGNTALPNLHNLTWNVGRKHGLVPVLHLIPMNEGRVSHVRYMVPIERGDDEGLRRYASFFSEVIPRVIREAGFVPARCFGLSAKIVSQHMDPGFYELYRRIKKALDPNNIMAPWLGFGVPFDYV
ncbi:MAG: FAD-binding oxidoreductase [Candidatus Methanomethyliaceae archaeon]|nr:FAD-binding oxidoreductase [Candidatus Methanomethyliaceae archaeon]MDW7970872.1 FAD-binding oxidoreductase [Nitrososphaerota archaeon]